MKTLHSRIYDQYMHDALAEVWQRCHPANDQNRSGYWEGLFQCGLSAGDTDCLGVKAAIILAFRDRLLYLLMQKTLQRRIYQDDQRLQTS